MDELVEFVRMLRRLRRDESGVAMMLTLAVVLVLYVLCAGVYAIGDTIREKIEMQNACDSAAYSAAVVQADGLSRMAMVNRALSWTYVQLTNMQLDYITHKWLALVVKRFNEDWKRSRDWARGSFSACIGCSDCESWFKGEGKGWFCGVYGISTALLGSGSGNVNLNNGNVLPISSVESMVNGTTALYNQYNESIPQFKKLIENLNGLFFVLNLKMQTSINATVEAILHANLPRRSDGTTDIEAGEEFLWRIFVTQPYDPYASGGASGYFSALRNTEADERIFLSMADGRVHKELLPYFSQNGEKPGGLDQWFIRSDVEDAVNGGSPIINPMENDEHLERSLVNLGICRVYKNANRAGTLKRTSHMRAHHSNISLLDDSPSCNNTHEFNGEQCATIDDSVALYADYEWRAEKHICACWPRWRGGIRHSAVTLPLGDGCSHKSHSGAISCSRNHSRTAYGGKSCFFNLGYYASHLACLLGCSIPRQILPRIPPYGFARIYGDDQEIFDASRYTGEVAKPWVLNQRFNGADGAIVVALARKQKNPWGRMLGMGSASTSSMDGLFQMFNPTEKNGDNSCLCAFSAGRAAYHYHPSSDAVAYGAVEKRDREYETRYDAVCDKDHVSIQGSFAGLRVGCVCGADNARRYARCWNLCETDWDAVLVPVRFARTNAGKYNSLVNDAVFWEDDMKPGSNLFKLALTKEKGDDGEEDGWHPFYRDGQRVSNSSDDVSSGAFLMMRQPTVVEDVGGGVMQLRGEKWYEAPDWRPRSRNDGWFMNDGNEDAAFKQRIL